jgi:ribosome-binding protein aMBF1 (putative translation factor)
MHINKITDRVPGPGPISDEERQRLQAIREKVKQEFPQREHPHLQPATSGVGFQIRLARETQGLTWNSLAEKAGVSGANVIRDIEYGREVTLANIEAVVAALGLKLEVVDSANR